MEVSKTKLDKVLLLKPEVFEDHRGTYTELYNEKELQKKGIDLKFVQDDISASSKDVLRGLHGDSVTWKLVTCVYGKFYLVVLNCENGSPEFHQWESFTLSDRNRWQVLIPPSFAVGHLVLSERAVFYYKQSTYYDRDKQFTMRWNNPEVGIWWPIKTPILSERDGSASGGKMDLRKSSGEDQLERYGSRAFFVDRDGVLNFERADYVKSINELKMIPGASEQIALKAQGFPYLIVVTNQSVVGRGIISEARLKEINKGLQEEFYKRTGRRIDQVYYCPHAPADNCTCRKPKIELFEKAAEKYDLNLTNSVFVGDKDTDEEAARRMGCGFIKVKSNTSEIIREVMTPV